MGRPRRGRRDLILAIIGLVAGMVLLILYLSPRVVAPQPEDLAISAEESLNITFNRPVSAQSLADRFNISPDISGKITVDGRQVTFQPDLPLAYGETFTITIESGVRDPSGLPGLLGRTMSFTVNEPRLLFLQESDGLTNLWSRQPSGELIQVTEEPGGVWDYQAAPNGRGILYSSLNPDESANLVLLTNDGERQVLLECPGERCISGQWQPGGSLVAYERTSIIGESDLAAEVWILDTENGEFEPAIASTMLGETGIVSQSSFSPRWSKDGRYLAFFQPEARVIMIRNMNSGEYSLAPANMELMAGWSPVSDKIVYTELVFGGAGSESSSATPGPSDSATQPALYSHIALLDLATESATDLNEGQQVDFGRASWHPQGESLAVPRGVKGGPRQIWLIPVDGSDQRALTNEPAMNHSSVAWSPDGRQLTYMTNDHSGAGNGPAIWLFDSETGRGEIVAEGAFLPDWQP